MSGQIPKVSKSGTIPAFKNKTKQNKTKQNKEKIQNTHTHSRKKKNKI